MQHFASLAPVELRKRDGIKAIGNYAGLPSTSEETKVLALCEVRASNPPMEYHSK